MRISTHLTDIDRYLWTIFKPGQLVCSQAYGALFKLHSSHYETEYTNNIEYLNLSLSYVGCGGEQFGYQMVACCIHKFDGTEKITKLPLYPLDFHATADGVRITCLNRGKRYEELSGMHYLQYSGPFWGPERPYTVLEPHGTASVSVHCSY